MRKWILVSALVGVAAPPVLAEDFYVSQVATGDGRSCSSTLSVSWFNTASSWANPKQPLKIGPGDTVYLCGTITGTLTFQGSGSDTGGVVTVDGANATMSADVNIPHRSYWTFQNGTWVSGYTSTAVFYVDGGHHGTIANNRLNEYTSRILFIAKSNEYAYEIAVRNNYFRSSSSASAAQHDVIATEGAHDILVEGNYIELRLTNNDQHIDIVQTWMRSYNLANKPYNLTLRYNWFALNTTTSQNHKAWCMVENLYGTNYVYGNVFVGVTGASETKPFQFDSVDGVVHVYNNTFVAKGTSAGGGVFSAGQGSGMTAKNNIVYAEGSQTLADPAGSPTLAYNLWKGLNEVPTSKCTDHCLFTDPLFTNYAAGVFTLQSTSPAIGKGTNLGSGPAGHSFDYGLAPGATWPGPALAQRTGAWDMGAYVSGSPSAPTSVRIVP
jgi:hypothetical protein